MVESNGGRRRLKRRGVRASRVKLERALAESDLERKTQAALAERIADLENLDAAPKDLVSKVFRELYVDPQTLERVARALGVEAQTLYFEAPEESRSERDAPEGARIDFSAIAKAQLSRTARIQVGALFTIAFLLFFLFTALAVRPAGPWCSLREAYTRPQAADGSLGLMVARFANDPENRAQEYLATNLAADETLAPYTSVLAVCARPRWSGPGEIRTKLAEIRDRGRRRLERAGAHVMVWGEVDGDDIIVRFISTRRDVSPFAVELSGRPLKVREENLELRVPLGRPSEALADMKRFALEFIETGDDQLAGLRQEALQSYNSSAEWLRAAIVSQRNMRRAVDPSREAQRWAAINMTLCYDLRLLGDYEADKNHYLQALEACDAALQVRPRDRFPRDWAAAQINKASSEIRLHYFADNRESVLKRLRAAEDGLLAVIDASDPAQAPQQRITAQRNLGVVYIRLGELGDSAESAANFEKGLGLLKTALAAQDPAYQPLDWAITQQNICLALYQHGARLGPDGAEFVRDAKARCTDAVDRLAPMSASLDWAMAQNNLAAATAILAQFEGDADGLEAAEADFAAAQTVYTRQRLPENWAEVELNRGELKCNIALLREAPRALDDALAHIDGALEIFIENGNVRYRRYADNLAASINACDRDAIKSCACGG